MGQGILIHHAKRVQENLWTDFSGEHLFCPAESGVGGRETDRREGEDDGVQDLLLRRADAEELADVRANRSL